MGLKERLEKKKREEPTHTYNDTSSSVSASNDNSGKNVGWKHKVISESVLSNKKKLQNRLNSLGRRGWKLVDTQRHSIAGKQHAVCFLRKRANNDIKEINDKLGELLELQKENSEESMEES